MSRISKNLSIVLHTERLIARRRLAMLRNQTGLIAFAGFTAGLGLIMIDVAAFLALRDHMSPQAAALIIALANLAFAAFLASAASRLNVETELKPVIELRDAAIADLEADVQGAAEEAHELAENVRQIARDPLGSLLPALIGPLLSALSGKKKS